MAVLLALPAGKVSSRVARATLGPRRIASCRGLEYHRYTFAMCLSCCHRLAGRLLGSDFIVCRFDHVSVMLSAALRLRISPGSFIRSISISRGRFVTTASGICRPPTLSLWISPLRPTTPRRLGLWTISAVVASFRVGRARITFLYVDDRPDYNALNMGQ